MNMPRFAVIGHPVKHSRSPSIHQLFAQQTGIVLTYERLEAPIDQFEAIVLDFFSQGGRGLNVTVPFKLRAKELARDHLSPRATLAQAVNTLWQQDNVLHGCNTDGIGLVRDLARLGIRCKGARILMVGAGGAAQGVMGPILDTECAQLHIVNRTVARADALVRLCQQADPASSHRISAGTLAHAARTGGWDLVINASSSSLSQAPLELPSGLYAAGGWAYDMMYAAQPTPFMLQAQLDHADATSDGLGMLVSQAAESFRLWHGIEPDAAPVLHALRAELQASIA